MEYIQREQKGWSLHEDKESLYYCACTLKLCVRLQAVVQDSSLLHNWARAASSEPLFGS